MFQFKPHTHPPEKVSLLLITWLRVTNMQHDKINPRNQKAKLFIMTGRKVNSLEWVHKTILQQPVCSPYCLALFVVHTRQITMPSKYLKQLDLNLNLNVNHLQTSVSLFNGLGSSLTFRAGVMYSWINVTLCSSQLCIVWLWHNVLFSQQPCKQTHDATAWLLALRLDPLNKGFCINGQTSEEKGNGSQSIPIAHVHGKDKVQSTNRPYTERVSLLPDLLTRCCVFYNWRLN